MKCGRGSSGFFPPNAVVYFHYRSTVVLAGFSPPFDTCMRRCLLQWLPRSYTNPSPRRKKVSDQATGRPEARIGLQSVS